MNNKIVQFILSALVYWLINTAAGNFLEVPSKIINPAVFVPPILGLMWGLPAALGVYLGNLFLFTEFQSFFRANWGFLDLMLYLSHSIWILAAGFFPYFLWQKILKETAFESGTRTLRKFIVVMVATFFLTSIVGTLTATQDELQAVAGWFIKLKSASAVNFFIVCFLNDLIIAVFIDIAIFFFLVSRNFKFYNSPEKAAPVAQISEKAAKDEKKTWLIILIFYLVFPAAVIYLNKFQIYGMNHLEIWLRFVVECLSAIDIYLVLVFYLMMRYRRSIMLEIVFLVSQTVFLSATVLGFGSSVALSNMVNTSADSSLHAMSVICRERLYRTFFIVRQAVNGMKLQALESIESYERLADDSTYRANYLAAMKNNFKSIAVGIDGSISYYLRFIPEIEGTKGGFSMQREEARWEGELSPFVEREPIDLAPYDPNDVPNVGWYYIPKKAQCATWIEPYVDAVTDFYVISYVAPLFLEGKFIGVVGMDIDFNFIIQELRRMSIYDYGYVYIMNRNNLVLYHRNQPQGALFQPNPEFQEIETYLGNGMWLGIALPLSRVHEERNNILMHLIAAIIIVAMIISVVSIELTSRAIKPLAGMTEAARRIASGDLDVKISYDSDNELGILVKSIREMASRLEDYVYRDKLTGLRNAAAFMSKSNELDAQSKKRSDLHYGVVIFDANFLKKVNDNYGHEAGNELLRHAAKVIRTVFANSLTYRTGGDEFAAILENQDYENRAELIQKFLESVPKEQFTIGKDTLTVSVACGLAIYEQGLDFAAVAKIADGEMYKHKAAIKAKFGEEVR